MSARQTVGFAFMVVGLFLAILDTQIVTSSLRELQAGLSAGPDEIVLVQTAYLVGEIVMIPLSGLLSRVLSTRILFTLSCIGFTGFSLACAGASSLDVMIVLRTAQGFLGGAMIPTVFATAFLVFPPSRQAQATLWVGLVATLAPTLGPVLGGYVTQTFSWPWLFLINAVPGVAVSLAVWILVDIDRPDWALARRIDPVGLMLLAVFLGSMQWLADQGPRQGWFDDAAVCGIAAFCASGFMLFLLRMLTHRAPLLELRSFRERGFSIGCSLSLVLGIGLYGGDTLVTFYLARVRDLDSLQIGEMTFVTGLFEIIGAPVAGYLAARLDARLMLALGFGLFAAGCYGLTDLTADLGAAELFWPQALRGLSLMLCFLPCTRLALGSASAETVKGASSLYSLMRNLGGTVGLAALGTIITDRVALHWTRLAETLSLPHLTVTGVLDRSFDAARGFDAVDAATPDLAVIAQQVMTQAMIMTFDDCFLIMACLFAGAMPLVVVVRTVSTTSRAQHGTVKSLGVSYR